jgi:hypothetical protein
MTFKHFSNTVLFSSILLGSNLLTSHCISSPRNKEKVSIKSKLTDNDLFECYPNFASDEVFLRCNWTQAPCVVNIDFHDTENKRTYKMRRTLAKGVQTLRFDVKNFSPGPYYVFIGTEDWNKVLDAGFVKVTNGK